MFEVEADVLALIIVDVHRDFLDQVEGLAITGLVAFEIGPDDVFGFFCGQALLKLPVMVGVDLVADFLGLVGRFANFDGDAVDGSIIRTPHGADDHCERLFLRMLSSKKGVPRTEGRQEKRSDDDRVER